MPLGSSASAQPDEAAAAKPEPEPQPKDDKTPKSDPSIDELREQIEELKEENVDLTEDVEDLFKEQQKPVERVTSLNRLNPQITAFANGAARIDDRRVTSPEGPAVNDKMFLRTVELDMRSAIDPFADGVILLSLEDEAGTGFAADIEEAYFILKSLPVLESAPLGLKLKVGRFRVPIGVSNRTHLHDLPWTTRPLPIVKLLGTEHGSFFESGFNTEGVDAEMLLPELIPGLVLELNLDVLDAHDVALTAGDDGWRVGLLGRLNAFFTAADNHDVSVGVSSYYEGGKRHAALIAGDFIYKWAPGRQRSLVLGGEVFYADRRSFVDPETMPGVVADSAPLGFYAFGQYQLGTNLYAGARFDYSEEIDDDSAATRVAALYASYYTTEFLRFRLGAERRDSDIAGEDKRNSLFFEVNFVIGSHPIEPYWVNR